MDTEIVPSYRPTINTAEQIKKRAIFKPLPIPEPCIFIYRVSKWDDKSEDFSTEYFVKKYNFQEPIIKYPESKLLIKIVPEKIKGTGIYFVKEFPLATDFYQWDAYRKAVNQKNYKQAREIKEKIILPEEEYIIRGIGFTLKQANRVAKRIVRKRANEIARKINYPILEEIINLIQ